MQHADTHKNFFRQSGWLMIANLLCGFCMAFVHPFAIRMHPESDYAVFMTMLRIFVLVTIPASALQTILAEQTAAAINDERRRDLAATARGLVLGAFVFWLFLIFIAAIFRERFVAAFQVSNQALLWATMLLVLAALWMPIFQGVLQGMQQFFELGWSMILNGVGRVIAIIIAIEIFKSGAAGATVGAFVGIMSAVVVAAWPARRAIRLGGGRFDWRNLFRVAAPLTIGAGSTLFLLNITMPITQAHFHKDFTKYYSAAEAIGIALVTLCVPIAAVMFPKVVRSRETGEGTNALRLGVVATASIALAAALFCTVLPKLPLQIMFFTKPEIVKAHVLIPWFMWAMIPVTMYNLLVNYLIARARYGIIVWAAVLPVAYALTLNNFFKHTTLAPFEAFRGGLQILMGFSSAMLAVAAFYVIRVVRADAAGAGSRSGPTNATPS